MLTIGDETALPAGREPSRIAYKTYRDGKIRVSVESYCHQVTKRNSEELGGKPWMDQMEILLREHDKDIEKSPNLLSAWLCEFHDVIDQKIVDCQDIDEGIQLLCDEMSSLMTSYVGDSGSSFRQTSVESCSMM
jgi:hypothetical protein